MNYKSALYLFILILPFCITSCGDDLDCQDEQELSNFLAEALTPVNSAIFTFSADPTEENCNRVVDALEEFIDDMEPFQECADDLGMGAEWRQDIEEARDELSSIDCTI